MTRGLAVALALALAGCGGGAAGAAGRGGKPVAPVLDPVKPAALREMDAALRALQRRGPAAREDAQARFEAAVAIDGTLWEAWHNLGVLANEDGDGEAAVAAFGRALQVNPAHTPSRIGRAEAHAQRGKSDEARADLEQCLRELEADDPLRAGVAARLAALLRDARKYDAAVEVLRDQLRGQGATSRIYAELGLIYLVQARLELAQLVLARALELDARDPAVHNALALLSLQQGKAQEAFHRFDQATSLDPDYLDARFNKASVLLDAGDHGRAKQELAIVVERKPDDHAARVALGLAHRGLRDFPGARQIWDQVILDAPRRSVARADALYNLAILKAFFLEDVQGAKHDLERYLQDAPASHPRRKDAEDKRKELGL
jgi:tetratricopeptide (TPR) repeat protein